jgi:hypothetical protein
VLCCDEELEALVDVLAGVVEFLREPAGVSDAGLEGAEDAFVRAVQVVWHCDGHVFGLCVDVVLYGCNLNGVVYAVVDGI